MLGRMRRDWTLWHCWWDAQGRKPCEGSTKLKPSVPGQSRASERTPTGAAHWVQTCRHPRWQSSITRKSQVSMEE